MVMPPIAITSDLIKSLPRLLRLRRLRFWERSYEGENKEPQDLFSPILEFFFLVIAVGIGGLSLLATLLDQMPGDFLSWETGKKWEEINHLLGILIINFEKQSRNVLFPIFSFFFSYMWTYIYR